jgi:uncharacterized membrane protein
MEERENNLNRSKSMWGAFLIGVGMMAGVDEIIFHQVLAWHHFYDRATPKAGLVADGLLHSAELIAIVAGFFRLLDLRRTRSLSMPRAWAGFILGIGGFHLFDGIVDHKVLRLHQIRYVEDLLPYDVTWNAAGLIILLVGFYLLRRAREQEKREVPASPDRHRQ